MKIYKAIFSIGLIACFSGCYYDNATRLYPAASCDLTNVTYSGTIGPLMGASCALGGCHDQTGGTSGIRLDDYASVKKQVDNGQLLGSIKHDPGLTPMPYQKPKLDDCTISKVDNWIRAGAPNN